jgi:hypothetical protein
LEHAPFVRLSLETGEAAPMNHRAWEATCMVRNDTSHPTGRRVVSFGIAVEALRSITTLINRLFG